MDFFKGDFNSQPVMALISCKTSSAMARNSGLFLAEGAAGGAVVACWARTGYAVDRRSPARSAAPAKRRTRGLKIVILLQDSRFPADPTFSVPGRSIRRARYNG